MPWTQQTLKFCLAFVLWKKISLVWELWKLDCGPLGFAIWTGTELTSKNLMCGGNELSRGLMEISINSHRPRVCVCVCLWLFMFSKRGISASTMFPLRGKLLFMWYMDMSARAPSLKSRWTNMHALNLLNIMDLFQYWSLQSIGLPLTHPCSNPRWDLLGSNIHTLMCQLHLVVPSMSLGRLSVCCIRYCNKVPHVLQQPHLKVFVQETTGYRNILADALTSFGRDSVPLKEHFHSIWKHFLIVCIWVFDWKVSNSYKP